MTRGLHVVAGEAKGLPLVAPRDIRPTTARVREAVFSALGDVSGAAVLDLFAGSGALAIEALSRGAARALLVDDDRHAVEACRENLATTHFDDRARVQGRSVAKVLRDAPPREAPFDLVCADPPYEADDDAVVDMLNALREPGWLAADARVLVERPARAPAPEPPPPWEVRWERKHGDTLVAVLLLSTEGETD